MWAVVLGGGSINFYIFICIPDAPTDAVVGVAPHEVTDRALMRNFLETFQLLHLWEWGLELLVYA